MSIDLQNSRPTQRLSNPWFRKPRGGKRSVACVEFDLISGNPYRFTREEIQFLVFLEREGISRPKKPFRHRLWDSFFAKPRACFHSSFTYGTHRTPSPPRHPRGSANLRSLVSYPSLWGIKTH